MSKITKGLTWSAIDHFSVQAIQFVLSIIIARLVSPSSYGIIVMVQVFLAFAQLFIDSGFKSALIQKKNRTEIDYFTVFNFNLIVSLLLYGIIFFSAPAIATFYDEPILTPLTRLVSLNLIFSSLSIVQLVHLQVKLDFKTQAKARFLSVIISGTIGIICAYHGMEVWALAIQGVIGTLFTSIWLMYFSHWSPKLIFSIASFKQMFIFGSKLLTESFLTTGYIHLTNLIIGKIYSTTNLAFYDRAFKLAVLLSCNISDVISRTVYPIFCELQDDRKAILCKFEQFLRLSCLIIFPIMTLVCVLSKPLVVVLLTSKWEATAPLLSIMCIVFIVYPIIQLNTQAILAIGRSGLILKTSLIRRGIAFSSMLLALPFSVTAIAYSLLFSNFIETLITIYCFKSAFHYNCRHFLKLLTPILCYSLISSTLAWSISLLTNNVYIQLFIGGTIGLLSYTFLLITSQIPERIYLINIIKELLRR